MAIDAPWYDNYIVLLSGVVVVALGLLYMAVHPAYGRSDAPYDDAIPASPPDVPERRAGEPSGV
ncbi:hypothetical protein ACFQMH_19835 [Streptomyces viridiviolaceus]|uniref:Uncharacterized protein n=1 Tax=Streptomyces viridiviolaceus TaxID=68282 RepID=A0ABW2E552_9ACTN|nr:hypothetical protein [Streptomyces viridiviolaceus]